MLNISLSKPALCSMLMLTYYTGTASWLKPLIKPPIFLIYACTYIDYIAGGIMEFNWLLGKSLNCRFQALLLWFHALMLNLLDHILWGHLKQVWVQ